MLNAAEAAMDAAAEDDAERHRNRARLYAPPKGQRRPRTAGHAAGRLSRADAAAMVAQAEADDARLTRRRGGGVP